MIRGATRFTENKLRGKEITAIAEVGVGNGNNALAMYYALRPKTFYLIDAYATNHEYSEEQCEEMSRYAFAAMETLKDICNIVWLIEKSHDAVRSIDELLDFVYIDASHDAANVKRDIACWKPLVRRGGVFGGHDWGYLGVVDGVKEMFGGRNTVYQASEDWWVDIS